MKTEILAEFEPTAAEIKTLLHRRKEREYQRRHRGDKVSAKDLYENAAIVIAWEAGEITEGQAARALGVDRVTARELKLKVTALGRAISQEAMTPDPKPEVPTLKLRKPEEIIITAADQNLCLGSGELKRCPFCGAHAMSSGERTANGRAIRWTIQCTGSKGCIPNCFASVIGVDPDQSTARRVAVERWNRRADSRLERENAALLVAINNCLNMVCQHAVPLSMVEAELRAAIKSATP